MSYDGDPYEGASFNDRPRSGGRPPARGGGGGRSSGGDHTREAIESGKYTEVKNRIQLFYAAYPTGALVTESVTYPDMGDGVPRVQVQAAAFRTPDDAHPGRGTSWLVVPGKTPYTNGSEVENAETSAWGRAIAAVGIAIDQGIASAQEIRSKHGGELEPPSRPAETLANAARAAADRGDKAEPETATEPPAAAPVLPVAESQTAGDPLPGRGGPLEPTETTETAEDEADVQAGRLEDETQGEANGDAPEAKEPATDAAPAQGLSYDEFMNLAREKFIPNGHISAVARELIEAGAIGQVGGVRAMSDQERLTLLMAAIAKMDDQQEAKK